MEKSAGQEIHVDLVPMYDYLEVDKVYFTDAIQKLTPDAAGRVTITPYPMTLEQATEIFESEDAAINVRYHASLICASLGIPQTQVVLVNHPHYPNKMRWIEDQFGESVTAIRTNQSAESIAQAVWMSLHRSKCSAISKDRVKNNAEHLKHALLLVKGEKLK